MYITYTQFTAIYGTGISEADFNRIGFQMQRLIDTQTTGLDGIRKLAVAFPTDEYAAECVVQCMGALIKTAYDIEQIQNTAGFTVRADGSVSSKVVTSVSSGSESISYSSGGGSSVLAAAAADDKTRQELYVSTVRQFLSGIQDANGVNVLYMGVYPCTTM